MNACLGCRRVGAEWVVNGEISPNRCGLQRRVKKFEIDFSHQLCNSMLQGIFLLLCLMWSEKVTNVSNVTTVSLLCDVVSVSTEECLNER